MNKMKLLYDVVKTLKDKEEIKGTFQAKGEKNKVQIFSFSNEFVKNQTSGEIKAKINTQVDCCGKKVKHESTTEFNIQDCDKHPLKGHWKQHCLSHCHRTAKAHGCKDKLNHFLGVLTVLGQIKVTEQANKSVLVSLDSKDLPAEIKQALHEKMRQHHSLPEQAEQQHKFLKECGKLTECSGELKVWINQKNEIEKVVLTAEGKGEEDKAVNLQAELSLTW